MKLGDESGGLRAGLVLAASPALTDPNFRETLVYLAEHDAQGSMGFILNRPTGHHLKGMLRRESDVDERLHPIPVYFGGPVRPHQLFVVVFRRGRTADDLRCELNAPLEQVYAHLDGGGWVRGFMGYSGWGEGQLEQEMAGHAWIVGNPHEALLGENAGPMTWSVFIGPDQRWRQFASHLPRDPAAN